MYNKVGNDYRRFACVLDRTNMTEMAVCDKEEEKKWKRKGKN